MLRAALAIAICLSACRERPKPPPRETPRPVEAPPAPPVTPPSPAARLEDEKNTIDIFAAAAPATVFVTQTRVVVDYFQGVAEEVPAGSGSGFVWDDRGHIVTNFHVVEGARSLTVTFRDQQTFEAEVVGLEPRKDLAVLRVRAPKELLAPIAVGTSPLEVGQKVVAIGNPYGLDHTLTTGVVSALGRVVKGPAGVSIRNMVQTDAAINPGNSGGPLLDSGGRLIGMNTMIYSKSGASAGIGFAVPASTIARVVPQLIKNGRADQVGFGIAVDPQQRIERRYGLRGVVVLEVPPGSPAAEAGMRGLRVTAGGVALGDVIVAVDGQPIADYDALYGVLDERKAGEEVKVEVRRGEETVTLGVRLTGGEAE
jgi:S1-C subfamily serine protease